jgi:hypothetical protein
MDAATGLTLLLQLLDRSAAWAAVVRQAQMEGRPISEAEIEAFAVSAKQSEDDLAAAIDKARAEGR